MSKQRKKKKKRKEPEKRNLGRDLLVMLFVMLVLALILLPSSIWTWLTVKYDAPNSGFLALGWFGALILGIAPPILVIRFLLRDKKSRGNKCRKKNDAQEISEETDVEKEKKSKFFNAVLLLISIAAILMVAYSGIVLFVPEKYEKINEKRVTLCAVSLMVAINWLIFGLRPFSADIEYRLRKARVSATAIRRARSTLAGKLWFAGLEKRGVQRTITIYRICLCTFAVSLVLFLFFSWNTVLLTAAGVLLTLLAATLTPIQLSFSANSTEKRGLREWFLNFIWYGYLIVIVWLEAHMTLDLWK